MNRRSFLHTAGAAVATPLLAQAAAPRTDQTYPEAQIPADAMVGVQIQPHSFYDEGIDHVLDLLQETAAINTLVVYTHGFSGGVGASELATLAQDHGVPVRDPRGRRVPKTWVRQSADAYRGLKARPPAEHPDAEYLGRDLFTELREPCRKRGMKLMGRILAPTNNAAAALFPADVNVMSVDIDGREGEAPCMNNPDYFAYWNATVADLFRNYPLDGFMFGLEYSGPLYRLVAYGRKPFCFCSHCQARMQSVGIDPKRLRTGYTELHAWVTQMRTQRQRPADGAFTTFLRHAMRYPEMLRWEREGQLALEQTIASLRDTIKRIAPHATVGRHLDHQLTTADLFYRAAVGFDDMAKTVDFIKIVAYHDVAAPRVHGLFVSGFGSSMFADFSREQVLEVYYALFGLDPAKEPKLEQLRDSGFSPDYVYQQTRRCVVGSAGKTKTITGIGFDIPKPAGPRKVAPHPSDPENVYRATRAAFAAGADGIIVCREYQEMRLPNLRAIGRALRDRR